MQVFDEVEWAAREIAESEGKNFDRMDVQDRKVCEAKAELQLAERDLHTPDDRALIAAVVLLALAGCWLLWRAISGGWFA